MSTRCRHRTGRAPRSLRALTAVAALYALVLQALLGGIAALPVAGAPALCATLVDGIEAASGDTAKDSSAKDHTAKDRFPPPTHHAGCCTSANHAPAAALPPSAALANACPERVAARADWRGQTRHAARPPPFTLAHARAPPTA